MFTEKITLPVGILVGGTVLTDVLLVEETFGHTLQASSMPGLDTDRMNDDGYFLAAKMAVRLTVPGLFEARMASDETFQSLVDDYAEARSIKAKAVTAAQVHPVTPELIEGMHPRDGRVLTVYNSLLEDRRSDFRKKALALPGKPAGTAKVGLHGSGSTGKESG
jgi:hypothetical protein